MEKVVVAYSGGLDTSYCVKYLIHEKNLEVHTILVNTGGFSDEELVHTEKRAYELGSTSHINKTILEEFYEKAIKYLIFGNVLKNNTYPGNDQIRFDVIFQALAPEIEIITPIRDLKLSRQAEVEFLKKHGVEYSWEKAQYSINKGIWGTSVGGKETLTSHSALPDDAYPSQLQKEKEETITLTFEKGELVGLDGIRDTPVKNIQKLEELASAFAIGRDIHVGDTIIGIKGRVGFEAAAPLVIIKAHHLLEKHVLTKWQQYWKEQLANWYGMLLHEGNYLDPVMRNIEVFLDDSQKSVTGDVVVKLKPYHFTLEGIASEFDMMKSDFGQYGEMNNSWTSDDAKGFIKIYGNANKIYHNVNPSES